MGIFNAIVSGVTKVVEFAAGAIVAAISAPSVATIASAVATVAIIAGGCFLIYKGAKYLLNKADAYITNKCDPEDAPTRINKLMHGDDKSHKRSSTDDIADDIADRVCRSSDVYDKCESVRYYNLDDRIDNRKHRTPTIDRDISFRDTEYSRPRRSSRFDVDPLYAYDLIGHVSSNGNCVDIYEPRKSKKKLKKIKKAKKYRANKMSRVADIRDRLDDLTIKSSGDEYLNSLPWIGNDRNITCLC